MIRERQDIAKENGSYRLLGTGCDLTIGGLFEGIGGFPLAAQWAGITPIWSNEIDPFCCKVLRKNFTHEIIQDDIRNIGKHNLKPVDIISGGFPASPLALQEGEKESSIIATSGQRCLELSERLGRPLLLGKMLLASPRWKMAKHLKKYSLTWKTKGTRSNRLLFQLAVLERGTEENDYGLLPTPTTFLSGERQTVESFREKQKLLKERNKGRTGNGAGPCLAMAIKLGWLPTPTAQDAKNSTLPPSQKERDSMLGHLLREGSTGVMNPQWIEWVMGFPTGWTELER